MGNPVFRTLFAFLALTAGVMILVEVELDDSLQPVEVEVEDPRDE